MSYGASSGTPTNGAARKSSAAVPAEDNQTAAEGTGKASVKAAGRSSKQSQANKAAKGKAAKGAAAAKTSDRVVENGSVKHETAAPSTKKSAQKTEPQKKKAEKSSTAGASSEKVKREKPQYDMPGQTQPTPDTGEPLAKFYLSLIKQRQDSEMAPKWCGSCLLASAVAEQMVGI